MTISEVPSLTLKVATPDELVTAGPEMVEWPVPARLTVSPGMGVPEESWRVTVTVEVAELLSSTDVGLATTDELVWLMAPWKVTVPVLVSVTELVVSVAV